MLILIAESKTMLKEQQNVSAETFHTNEPAGEDQADAIMKRLGNMSVAELTEATGFPRRLWPH